MTFPYAVEPIGTVPMRFGALAPRLRYR